MKSNKRYKPIYNEDLGVDTVYDNLSKKQVPLNRQSVADELNKLWSQVQRFERENARLRRDNHKLKEENEELKTPPELIGLSPNLTLRELEEALSKVKRYEKEEFERTVARGW